MYAVLKTGGKQYRVCEGDVIRVEKLPGNPGDAVTIEEVLLVAGDDSFRVGRPLVEGAQVRAEIVDQARRPKILVYKYKRRKRYRRKAGHRQAYTALKITTIQA